MFGIKGFRATNTELGWKTLIWHSVLYLRLTPVICACSTPSVWLSTI